MLVSDRSHFPAFFIVSYSSSMKSLATCPKRTALGLPGYDRWWREQDETASYRRYADNLRLIGADVPAQRWLLKNPGHISHLDALFAVFPDACVVQTHRDPAKSIPSVCSVSWNGSTSISG